ncbi:MAG: RNA-binding S4 domain-containing protein [Synergistales bacterium]|nr:RNA-binding S4 domain-containing protein [Synergistales bacterium]
MRLDLYLKRSRLVKRRARAREMVEVGAVRIDGREGKPATAVTEGARIEIAYPRRLLVVRVVETDDKQLKRGAKAFEVLEERRVSGERVPWEE